MTNSRGPTMQLLFAAATGTLPSKDKRMGWLLLAAGLLLVMALLGPKAALAQTPTPVAIAPGAVVRIHFATRSDANRLAGQYDVWAVDYKTHVVTAYLTNQQFTEVQAASYTVEIDTSRMRSLLPSAPSGAGAATVPDYPCYRTVDETYATLKKLATDHPTLARWVDIGDTWLKTQGSGGSDIYALVLTDRARSGPKPRFFLMAAIHPREMATAEVATRFAEQLVSRYAKDPEVTWLLDYTEIHIVAQSDPDGRKRAEASTADDIANTYFLWRKNVDDTDACMSPIQIGVDLNRNSSFKWSQCDGDYCSSNNSCDPTYRGRSPASEPETQALQNYIKSLFADQRGPADTDKAPVTTSGIMVSLHSYSQLILFPWGWTATPTANDQWLRTLGRKFGYFTGYVACQAGEPGCIYQTDGTTDDFAYGELGIAAYTYEIGTTFFESCSSFENNILDKTLAALMYAAKSARAPYKTPAGPDVVSAMITPAQVLAGTVVTLTVTVDDTRYDSNDPAFGTEPVQNIAGASYTIDKPDWITGTITKPLTAVSAFDSPVEQAKATITTTGWSPGRHTVFVTGADVDGNRGAPTAVFIDIPIHTYLPFFPHK